MMICFNGCSNATWVYIGGCDFKFDKCNHVHSNAFIVEGIALQDVGYDLELKM